MELTWRGTDPPPDRNAVRTSADVNFGVRVVPCFAQRSCRERAASLSRAASC